jgi:indoleamine 2,3-dioxygenase
MPKFAFSQYGIDAHTGFLTPEPPLRRLSGEYEQWEILLDEAKDNFVHTGPSSEITLKQRAFGCMWRKRVRKVCVSPVHLTS